MLLMHLAPLLVDVCFVTQSPEIFDNLDPRDIGVAVRHHQSADHRTANKQPTPVSRFGCHLCIFKLHWM